MRETLPGPFRERNGMREGVVCCSPLTQCEYNDLVVVYSTETTQHSASFIRETPLNSMYSVLSRKHLQSTIIYKIKEYAIYSHIYKNRITRMTEKKNHTQR